MGARSGRSTPSSSRDRRILIEDWDEGIWQLGPDDEQQLVDKAARVDLQAMKDEWGITGFARGRDGIDAIRARSYEPTANIQGIIAGYTGPGTKTIVPNEARARLDFRLIPNIQPADAIRKLKAHLVKHGFGHIEVRANDGAEPPYKISVKEDISQAIIAAATEVYGEVPVVNGVSAEGAILRHVWIPCVLTGFANPGANLHAPDENIHLDKYLLGHQVRGRDHGALREVLRSRATPRAVSAPRMCQHERVHRFAAAIAWMTRGDNWRAFDLAGYASGGTRI